MMKLYFDPQSRSQVAKWMLDEAGVDYEIVPTLIREKAHKKPDYLKINPAGKLPALVDGRTRVFENAAICMYVAEKFPQARLAPSVGSPDRGRYLSLMVYSTAQLEPSMGDSLLGLHSNNSARGWTHFEQAKDAVERELGYGPYLFGAQFTAADVMIGSMFIWHRAFGGRSNRPKIDAYIDRLQARPKGMKFG
ncbi:putative glutathione S-transferase [Variovorax paradoxus B4]|uniref:Disulfide-bond oxidoreductase YfcG n=2 Tax=Variovorax paradoxus TaxID=34073 RepID=A0A0H2MPD0_VARPD|nr:glutathione S-transferase family protein [Variovorax paradoxus]AGU50425.1 putative glutathione S-transferase [Variovorax paradoxus B4]KLN58565.1 disulfide-bond oxidoreductase YfcG [Variovorax paradoxus]